VIRKSYAALQNLVTSLPNPNLDPNPNISGQVESESEKNGSDPHHWSNDIFSITIVSASIFLLLFCLRIDIDGI
jgi:hypothetical protein